ncbi:helix-turn-helix transcriptional regulator [Hydrogenophaga sp. SL48]|uniref:helix-turn-helix transcriptional regulator n=1 Tax=Hydrogenophaga sp. SL48 TaxID=2806347 RepID=UPI001F197B7D|nr:YafY family protein [Hydrogenophaga sp. SL48]UJW80522.1 YafY family transcriptional regulator [Hydrogenophaga sp. SL48]
MKASRLLSILMLLQAHGRQSAPALARALEVSVRTVLRDIDQLSAAGVPLWGERGRQGGFQLREGWSTTLTGMTEPESQALLLAGLPGAATDLGLGAAAASARLKMVASLPAEWREQADRVGARLHIDPVDWYRSSETPEHLRAVAEAVWNARRVAVRYESWRGQTERELEPLGLVMKAGTWYMAARVSGQEAVRSYRLTAVKTLRTLPTKFRRPKSFDLAAYWQASAARFEAELRALQARVAVSPRALGWLHNERIPFTPDAAPGGIPARPDWTTVLMPIESIEHGARRLLSYGAEAEVIAPPALRQRLLDELAATRARYADA